MKWLPAFALFCSLLAAGVPLGSGEPTAQAQPSAKTPQHELPRLKLWDRVMRERWEKTDRLLRQADALLAKREFPRATELLERAIAARPYAPALWFALGTVHSLAERYTDCVKALNKCRSLDPKFRPDLLAFRLGLCLSLSGRIAAGIAEYRRVKASDEVGGEVLHWNLGDNHMALGRLEEAVTHYEEALRLNPGRPVLHFALAVALDRQGRWDSATRRVRYGLRLDPLGKSLDSGDILWLPPHEHTYYRALISVARGERAQALNYLQRFHRADPRSSWRFVMRLRADGLRTRPIEEGDLRAPRGPLDAARAASALASRQEAMRRCLGTLPESWTVTDLRGVTLAIALSPGRPPVTQVGPTAGAPPSTAAACLQREVAGARWGGVLKGREAASWTLEIVGP